MKTHRLLHFSVATLAVALVTATASAKPGKEKGHGNGNSQGNPHGGSHGKPHGNNHGKPSKFDKDQKKAAKNWQSYSKLDDSQRRLVSQLFQAPNGGRQLPPGLAKNAYRGKPLPPGWQKKLAPGYRLDDDLFGAFTEVPPHLIPGFNAIPGTRLYYHENRLVRLLDATREIIDVVDLF